MGIADKLRALREEKAAKNKAEGLAFIAANLHQPNIISLPSGLQYEILNEGEVTSGKPQANSVVTCHYKGYTLDSKVFDSSYERGRPASFPLQQVIKGWTEGLQLMNKNAKYRFFIPSDLAYGDRQVGTDIAPYSTLIFEVELLDF